MRIRLLNGKIHFRSSCLNRMSVVLTKTTFDKFSISETTGFYSEVHFLNDSNRDEIWQCPHDRNISALIIMAQSFSYWRIFTFQLVWRILNEVQWDFRPSFSWRRYLMQLYVHIPFKIVWIQYLFYNRATYDVAGPVMALKLPHVHLLYLTIVTEEIISQYFRIKLFT